MDDFGLHGKAHNIWNLDESGYNGIKKNKKIVVKRGEKIR
jgi:hypothetical protein